MFAWIGENHPDLMEEALQVAWADRTPGALPTFASRLERRQHMPKIYVQEDHVGLSGRVLFPDHTRPSAHVVEWCFDGVPQVASIMLWSGPAVHFLLCPPADVQRTVEGVVGYPGELR